MNVSYFFELVGFVISGAMIGCLYRFEENKKLTRIVNNQDNEIQWLQEERAMYKYKYENKQCKRSHLGDINDIEQRARKASGYTDEFDSK